MKKLNSLWLFAIVLLITSCSEKKATPEEEVRNYGKYFVEKLAAAQLDSLTNTYPDIAKADSIFPIQSDTIIVVETTPGQYDLTLAEGISLQVNRTDDGKITVTESKGLFAFPDDKVEIAKKTGMWDDNLSDAQLNERMMDEEFFKYIQDQIKKKTSNILTVGKQVTPDPDMWDMYYYPIINSSNQQVDASDYEIIVWEGYTIWDEESDKFLSGGGTRKEPGKTIPPHGKIKYDCVGTNHGGEIVKGINWKLTSEQLQEKFASYTGNEYQEYLDSKK
ncbi:MAG: hypothetical protein J1E95_02320 [Muribaculaceae bacterium]|nr:hypothetical protein [Muribaculaceae bacterium]